MNSPTTEDRIWAVISHLSALALGIGIVLPIIGWADQRRKSNYSSFQCLQALGYQSLGYTIWLLSHLVIIILASIMLIVMFEPSPGTGDAVLGPGMIVFFILVFGFFVLYFLLPIIAAVACALGRDFRYPFMGDRLARYLEYDPAQKMEKQVWLHEDNEFRWVAAMGHFSILILIWGMLAPLTAWILHGKHSLFLKFQSIQTLVYQAAATILSFVALFIYLFGLLLLAVATTATGGPDLNSPTGILSIVIFGALLLISFLILLSIPLLHILGQWAGYRVLKGDDYRYPVVGKLVDKWTTNKTLLAEARPEPVEGTAE